MCSSLCSSLCSTFVFWCAKGKQSHLNRRLNSTVSGHLQFYAVPPTKPRKRWLRPDDLDDPSRLPQATKPGCFASFRIRIRGLCRNEGGVLDGPNGGKRSSINDGSNGCIPKGLGGGCGGKLFICKVFLGRGEAACCWPCCCFRQCPWCWFPLTCTLVFLCRVPCMIIVVQSPIACKFAGMSLISLIRCLFNSWHGRLLPLRTADADWYT